MYKNTRHTGRMWNYKASSVRSPSFDSEEECRAIVSKCQDTFIALGLLRDDDFEQLVPRKKTVTLTTIVGIRMRRGRERLEALGVPKDLIFAAPSYLLIAPRLGGLLARMSRMSLDNLPQELRALHGHIRQNKSAFDAHLAEPHSKTLHHTTKDGKRSTFTSVSGSEIDRYRSPNEPASTQRSNAVQEKQPSPVESIFRCDLKPSPAQKAALDSLFSGPLLLKALLLKTDQKPKTPKEASMFLLEHREKLQPYLDSRYRDESVDLLKKLVIQWASSVPSLIELQFSGDCSLSDTNQIFLPIPRLGTVPVYNEIRLIEARLRARSRYKPAFTLVRSTLGYLIEIVFLCSDNRSLGQLLTREPEERGRQRSHDKASPRKEQSRTEPPSGRLEVGRFVTLFGALDQRRANETRIAQKFVRSDFSTVEGRAVQGGLPSLGKRRK
ncbi:hypothetical protein [Burkholderia anthina]|uniref:hypothetical protein n=1 Tax=Burkholderia anthina TaxID=179879 RepID=UPI002931CEC2|nr:hypothetical protein [Burkholderia anthina]WJN75569.1 hypothetical protein OH687_01805 [Burkholderia anthina]